MEVQDKAPLLRPAQAAAILSVSTRTLRRYLSSGVLASYRLPSGQLRISEAALEGLLVESAKPGARAKKPAPAPSRRECLALGHAPVTSQALSGQARSGQARPGQSLSFDTSSAALSSLRANHGGAA
jgi:excisionase family DNA binding protein